MTRAEFVQLVNDVAENERNDLYARVQQLQARNASTNQIITDLAINAANGAARCAAELILKLGLVQLDD